MKCIVHTYSYTGPRLIKMAQRRQFRSVHSMNYNTKYAATTDQPLTSSLIFILPWRILFCCGELYFAVANFILPRWIVFCREEFYFAVKNFILPWRILFCREEFYFAVIVVGHRTVCIKLTLTRDRTQNLGDERRVVWPLLHRSPGVLSWR